MKTVNITWRAFGSPTSITFTTDVDGTPLEICEQLFAETNKYHGELWNIIDPLLPENRTHTALSVGDEVQVNDTAFRCAPIGWEAR
jgi:hypothetical protein